MLIEFLHFIIMVFCKSCVTHGNPQALASNAVELLFISDVDKMIRKYNQIGFVAHYIYDI